MSVERVGLQTTNLPDHNALHLHGCTAIQNLRTLKHKAADIREHRLIAACYYERTHWRNNPVQDSEDSDTGGGIAVSLVLMVLRAFLLTSLSAGEVVMTLSYQLYLWVLFAYKHLHDEVMGHVVFHERVLLNDEVKFENYQVLDL